MSASKMPQCSVENTPSNPSALTIVVLIFLVILPMLATDIYLPALPNMANSLAANHAAAMLTLTAYMLGYAISLILAGIASDRYGRRPVILVGIVLFCAASLACALTDSIAALIVFRFLQALGGGCGTLLARVVVRDSYNSLNQVRILSYLSAGLALSPTLGPIFGGYLASTFGWRSPFIFIALFSCVAGILTFYALRETHPAAHRKVLSLSAILTQYRVLLCHREFIVYTLIISLAWSVYFSFLASSSFILQQLFGLTPLAYGYAFALVIAGYVIGTVVARKQIGRRSIQSLIRAASITILLSSSLLMLLVWYSTPNLVLMLLLVSISLAGVGVIFPTSQAAVMQPFTQNVGLVAGLFYAIEMLFGALSSWLLGYFRSDTPVPMAILMACSALLLFGIVQYFIPAHTAKIQAQQ
jgi:MFS transporter, DHA1 family, multidrug resistance protein